MSTQSGIGDVTSALEPQGRFNDAIFKCAHILLRRVFRILRGCGFTEAELRDMARIAVSEVEKMPDGLRSRVTARQAMMCCDIVLKWRRDCDYLNASGEPIPLSFSGGEKSFARLVRASALDANPNVLLAAMEELGVVRITDDKIIELISESVVTCSGQDGLSIASECVLEHICGFLGSVEFNVFDKPSRAEGRFERACYASVPKQLVPVLQQLVSSRGQTFVDVIDEWLARKAVKTNGNDDCLLVGAGAYVFVRENFS